MFLYEKTIQIRGKNTINISLIIISKFKLIYAQSLLTFDFLIFVFKTYIFLQNFIANNLKSFVHVMGLKTYALLTNIFIAYEKSLV